MVGYMWYGRNRDGSRQGGVVGVLVNRSLKSRVTSAQKEKVLAAVERSRKEKNDR